MEYILDAAGAKFIDKYTIDKCGISGDVLMENAASKVVSEIVKRHESSVTVLCVAGKGNNGGDAIVVNRLLNEKGYKSELAEAGKDDFDFESFAESAGKYDVIVDGLFGIGLNRPVQGVYLSMIEYINRCRIEGACVYSVDIASGINASTGEIMGECVKADYTVTFGYKKLGHVIYPGKEFSGEVSVHDIGFSKEALQYVENKFISYGNKNEADKYLPERRADSNKGSYGRVLIVAGSDKMPGACILASKSALRSGCGLVTACSSERALNALVVAVPEVILMDNRDDIPVERYSSCLIGPGLGVSDFSSRLMHKIIENSSGLKGLVIDADAINILAKEMDNAGLMGKEERLRFINENLPENTVFTPHKKELSRLFNIPMEELKSLLPVSHWLKDNSGVVFVLKDAATVVAGRKKIYINQTGNNGMSTAGSGDVLGGIIVSFIAQNTGIFTAACLGVYLHGYAGDKARDKYSEYGVTAGDITDGLAEVIISAP